jgi:linoleoyl-CoA desaturase
MASISFNSKEHPFLDQLQQRIDRYFTDNNLNRWGDYRIYIKTALFLLTAVSLYTWLVFFTPNVWLAVSACAVLGLVFAGIGFNVMHDSAHGSFSNSPWVNDLMGYSLNVMGGDVNLWKTKHNLIHHSFTNIEGYDDDIDIQPFMRLHKDQPRHKAHRYQHIYGFLLYAINYTLWVFYFDFKKYFSMKIGATKIRKYKMKDHLVFWATKTIHVVMFFVLPIYFVGLVPALVGYLIMTVACGLMIAIVFQLAHVVEGIDFPAPQAQMQNEWAVHQINTTSNFAVNNRLVRWYTGGLNHQVEHHLFPRISHVHYPELNKIVKETCAAFQIKYNEHPTVMQAVRSHVAHLRHVGRHD